MREDIAREEKDQILYDKIFDDIWKTPISTACSMRATM